MGGVKSPSFSFLPTGGALTREEKNSMRIKILAGVLFVFWGGFGSGLIPVGLGSQEPDATGVSAPDNKLDSGSEVDEKWGVKILTVRSTAEGYMLDFRYRVTDAEKSMSLLSRDVTVYLIDQKTGSKLPVVRSRFGPMRQTALKPTENRVYAVVFSNSSRSVKKGDKVTVVIGDFRAENLPVQ
jgi:hypothetical protein